ncbi:small integral membrane protein 14 [Halictus rubicundus]|uniref:small integral membrane protein 14 n=1 Tax=Halictus rubicundus TaxID=77578 RepID=UPI004036CDC9
MDEEGFDICKIMDAQEVHMQQLFFILRQSHDYCMDSECLNLSQFQAPRNPSSSNFMMTFLIIAFMVIMYALRPNSFRRLRNENAKDRDNGRDSNNEPPAPPPAIQ